jgi:ABC-type phosphate transport system substrate-binding protein
MSTLGRAALGLVLFVCLSCCLAGRAAANPITEENDLPGSASWTAYKHLAAASTIEGYASESSVSPGDTLHLHVNSPSSSYRVEVDRLGWYAGAGGRRLLCLPSCAASASPHAQTNSPLVDGKTGKLDANWTVTDTVQIGSNWVSGYYVAIFTVTSGPEAGKVAWYPFIVTPPSGSSSAIVVQVPINTWQAYNPWPGGSTGKSLYNSNSAGGKAAAKVSFNRPFLVRPSNPDHYYQDPVFEREVQAVRFLEREGYDVSYVTDADVDRNPALLLDHRVDMVLGHDEYWSAAMREGWDAALAAGHNELFMGADIGTWLVRYEDKGRTLVGYKFQRDPLGPPTVMFRDQRPPHPECELEGVQYDDEFHHPGLTDYTVPPGAAANPWIRAAGLGPGDTIHAAVGYEWDAISPACATPSLETLFHYEGPDGVSDADAVTFTAPGGGRVFATGSNMFANMLDSYNGATSQKQVADPRIQAFTNALMGDFLAPPVDSGGPTSCLGSDITVKGSSLQTLAQEQVWAPTFATEICDKGNHPTVSFNSTGSGVAMREWNFDGKRGSINTALPLVGTSAAPTAAQIANIDSVAGGARVTVIPIAQTSIAAIANPPDGCKVEAISNSQLAGVFEGRIPSWSQLETATGAGCASPIVRVVRGDSSGTTYQFKNYLYQVYKKGLLCTTGATEGKAGWQEMATLVDGEGGAPNTSWPETCAGKALSQIVRSPANGGGEEVKRVNATPGGIGYAALPEARASKAAVILQLQNNGQKKAGEATFANPATGSAANCSGTAYRTPPATGGGVDIDWSQVFGGQPSIGGAGYPLCALTYVLAFAGYHAAGFSLGNEQTVYDYLTKYVVGTAGQEDIDSNYYARLPGSSDIRFDVLGAARTAAAKIGW